MLALKIALAAVLVVVIPPFVASACLWSLGAILRMTKTGVPDAPQSSRSLERTP